MYTNTKTRSFNKYSKSRNNQSFGRRNNRRTNNRGPKAQYISPDKFVRVATMSNTEIYQPKHTFNDFVISDKLKKNLEAKGYVTPSPIQDQTIPVGLMGKDIIGIASTGTGKTAAFSVPILNKLVAEKDAAALIVAPTRELAQQIEEECRSIGKNTGLMGALLIGGTNISGQIRDLRHNPRIVIGTPGRIIDHIDRGTLNLTEFNLIALDEVDRMLDMGFINDVTSILDQLSEDRQSYFFSATMDDKIRKLISRFTKDPETVSIKASTASENVHQDVVRYVDDSERMEKLETILSDSSVSKVIVFDETQRSVERLSRKLYERGYSSDAIHGGKSQGQRQKVLEKFKSDKISILVATDVAARGIDVNGISHVINYSTPKAYDDYIHRIGRAGRAGQVGYALTFVSNR